MNKKTLVMSPADSKIYEFFERQFNVISSDCLKDFISYEQYHADMQLVKIKEKLFINADCKELIKKLRNSGYSLTLCHNIGNKYPDNVQLNVALIGNKLLCNENALHPLIKEYCNKSEIEIINVKQGYTKCSTLILNDNSIITDDVSICKTALKSRIEALFIEKGDIYLDENTIGFIGGASGVIGETVYFFGDINTHRNAREIKEFLAKKNLNIECISSERLSDIGGIIALD